MKDRIYYFVDDIDTSFVLNDIRKLASHTKELLILSTEAIEREHLLPSNVSIIEEFIDWKRFKPLNILVSNFFTIISIYINECLLSRKFIKPKSTIALICSNIHKAKEALRAIEDFSIVKTKNNLFLAFWFYDCIYLAFLKKWGNAEDAVCRAHGGDLFEERSSLNGKVLLRNFQLKYLNHVFSVSETGSIYLKQKYPNYAQKISVSYLGSKFHIDTNPFSKNEFVLVSCAKIRDVKRIHLIAEALLDIGIVMSWYHLGDENLDAKNDPTIDLYKQAVSKLRSKQNIRYIKAGNLSNEALLKFYKEQPINLFISVSAAEGITVSMMEAISYGFPILSTDVGGCKEIVNQETGMLIFQDPNPELINKKILEFRNSGMNTIEFRKKVREYWEQYFNEDINYGDFIKK